MMNETSKETIDKILQSQKTFFGSQATRDIGFRRKSLWRLKESIKKFEKQICDALWTDLHKSVQESYLTEISIVLQEIDLHLQHLGEWSKTKSVATPVAFWPSKSTELIEPLGVALIVAPWNYPVQLLLNPLVGAISAGCCAIVKPSPAVPAVAKVLEQLIKEVFPPEHVALVHGARETNEILFASKFDIIFFTGSTQVGKVVAKAAAENLVPVILELGGKSPCVVTEGISLKLAARRIIWGKCMNAGQTCIAPDYLLVKRSLKNELLLELKDAIEFLFGPDVKQSEHYGRIVSDEAFNRLTGLLKNQHIYFGGETDAASRYIQPVIMDEVKAGDAVMQGEIFGPLLPVMYIDSIEEAVDFINERPKPLALYFFGSDENANKILKHTSSGGVCINDTLLHIANHDMPFGGVGESGQGRYHGKESFLAFSHRKPVVKSSRRIDLPFKYAPYKFYDFIRRIV